ncbi:MAG: glycosyltransferase family 1 protein [Candidatus Erginobacter occultus]|nr:glycosyltransferase family 1 protein [Candidatus Erginobacter occultus]
MEVCLNIQAAVSRAAGVGRYTRNLAQHLAPLAASSGDRLRLFYFDFQGKGSPPAVPGADLRPFRLLPGRLVEGVWRYLPWPDFTALAGTDSDIYHFPNFVSPPLRRGRRSVITIHDMSYLRFPRYAEPGNLRRLRRFLPRSAARSDAIITISRFSAAEIATELGVDPARIHVTYLGVEPRFRPTGDDAVKSMRAELGLDRPYLLTVGTLEPRKNHIFAVEVWERLGEKFDGLLAVAGSTGWRAEPILERFKNSPRAGDIRLLSYVPEDLLPALYSGAEALLFPSLYEGFGLPPLEALACGTPVVSSEGGALPEILDTPAVVRPGVLDVEAWRDAVENLLGEDCLRRRERRETGRQYAARFSWAETARMTWEVYRGLLA